ncbi:hypothetical protein HYPSUDRAFT_48921 [Hypholoma sublateritium FD-334 SS-4]|uniref:DUF7918 domain-containing protein n=1 Tax=Hypholoma sublateritium (strain FD-334 SS-4) TaxID=945553 RepID=A0A0D2NDP0_HYPSF|nr:hypothetical protein HYPSUDRAFT_48921 [Hypholoma sublateritium FD-334 SS-4]
MEAPNGVLSCDGFEAWIVVDGVPCTQYSVQYEERDAVAGPKASCWIASTADKAFSINIKKGQDSNAYKATVYLDEQRVRNLAVHNTPATVTISKTWVSDYEAKNFLFAPLELTDDDSYLENPALQNIGSIRVVLTRGTYRGRAAGHHGYNIVDTGKVHERSKKGLSHRVKYGPVERSENNRKFCAFDVHGKPVTFLFRYRPLDMLQASEIAPRTRSLSEGEENNVGTVVKEEEEIINVDSDDEKEKELLAQLESVRNKKRAKQDDGRLKKKVKTEPVRHFMPGEVIDLTL